MDHCIRDEMSGIRSSAAWAAFRISWMSTRFWSSCGRSPSSKSQKPTTIERWFLSWWTSGDSGSIDPARLTRESPSEEIRQNHVDETHPHLFDASELTYRLSFGKSM